MDPEHTAACQLHGDTEQADPNCKHCNGSGWIGDIVCPACS